MIELFVVRGVNHGVGVLSSENMWLPYVDPKSVLFGLSTSYTNFCTHKLPRSGYFIYENSYKPK